MVPVIQLVSTRVQQPPIPTRSKLLLLLFLAIFIDPSAAFQAFLIGPTAFVPGSCPSQRQHRQLISAGSSQPLLMTRGSPSFSIDLTRSTSIRHHPMSILSKTLSSTALESESNKEQTSSKSSKSMSTLTWLSTVCLPLWLAYVSNQWSRSSLYYLVDFSSAAADTDAAGNPASFYAMNLDIGFDQTAYGLLASIVFTSLFAIASLGAGAAADRYNRKTLTIASAVTWSLATFGTAVAASFEQVVACRIIMGLACAFATPTAYTLIRERVPNTQIALASSIYGTGVAIGSGLSSLTLLLDSVVGWRQALTDISFFGGASVIATALLLQDDPKPNVVAQNVTNPSSDEGNVSPVSSILNDVTEALETRRVQWIFLASFLRFCSGLCIGVWGAPYFRMAFASEQSQYSVVQAGISAVGASVSGLLGGAIADRLAASARAKNNPDPLGQRLWVPVVGSILAAPTWYLAIHSDQAFSTSMIWLASEYFVAECWFGPTIGTLQSTVGPRIGGTAQGLFTLTGAIANFAPSILGYMYGQATTAGEQASSANALSDLLGVFVCGCYLASAACFAVAAQSPPPPKQEQLQKAA